MKRSYTKPKFIIDEFLLDVIMTSAPITFDESTGDDVVIPGDTWWK